MGVKAKTKHVHVAGSRCLNLEKHPVECFISEVLDGGVIPKLIAQLGFEDGREGEDEACTCGWIALPQSGQKIGIVGHFITFGSDRGVAFHARSTGAASKAASEFPRFTVVKE